MKSDLKKNHSEKRRQDGNEWKSLKKTDCGRLETVMEEGQLYNEEVPSKFNSPKESNKSECDIETDQIKDFSHSRKRKGRMHELVAISEQPEFWKKEEENELRIQSSSEK